MASLSLYGNRNGVSAADPLALARELFNFDAVARPQRTTRSPALWPAFDVRETEQAYLIEADLPGVKDSDIEVSLDGRALTLSGTRTTAESSNAEHYHVAERTHGSFSRTFTLPKEANADLITAKLTDGVLSVVVPKIPEAKPRKIPVT